MTAFSITSLAERIILLEGKKSTLLAICAGGLSALSLAPFHLFPILFVTIPVLVWLLDGAVAPVGSSGLRRFWPAFRTGWLFGFGYFLVGLWWIGKAFLVDADGFLWALPFAVLGMPIGLAIFWGLGTAVARLVWSDGWVRLVGLAAALTMTEYLRGTLFTGFPWNLPGYAFMPNAAMMQSASLIGTYGVTFFTLFIASAPAIFAPGDGENPRRVRAVLVAALVLFTGHIGVGYWILHQNPAQQSAIKVRLVQPNIDQAEKWLPGMAPKIFQTYLDLSKSNTGPTTNGAKAFHHIIWPESAFPFILAEQRDALTAIAELLPDHTTLITGAMRREPAANGESEARVFNSALVLNGNGEIIAAQDKTRLVPFGEFLPFQEFLEKLGLRQLTDMRGGFAAGTRRNVIELVDRPSFLPLICYEVVYPGGLLQGSARPDWIVNLTNDAWFGNTFGPYQHAHQTRVRAAEEGLTIVRVANSGISFVADPWGRVEEQLPVGVRAVLDSRLPKQRADQTIFAQYGNLPLLIIICMIFAILLGLRDFKFKRLQ